MNHRLTWMLKTVLVMGIILLCNYPVAFTISNDISPYSNTLIVTLLTISLLYSFSALCGPHHFHAVLIGLLAGNLLAFLTWVGSFLVTLLHINDYNTLSTFYSVGIFIPAAIQFFLSTRHDTTETRQIHIVLTTLVTLSLFGYLVYRLYHRLVIESSYFNFFHFSSGFLIGCITAGFIHLVLTRNLLVFHRLYLYLEVMLKPIIAFFLGYLSIILTFTGFYALAYFSDPAIFSRLTNDRFGDLLFYSFSVITGMGFSVIMPEKPVAFVLTTIENFMGLIWITVVFAAAIAYLQEPFRKISVKLDRMSSREKK